MLWWETVSWGPICAKPIPFLGFSYGQSLASCVGKFQPKLMLFVLMAPYQLVLNHFMSSICVQWVMLWLWWETASWGPICALPKQLHVNHMNPMSDVVMKTASWWPIWAKPIPFWASIGQSLASCGQIAAWNWCCLWWRHHISWCWTIARALIAIFQTQFMLLNNSICATLNQLSVLDAVLQFLMMSTFLQLCNKRSIKLFYISNLKQEHLHLKY
jgi:hypothetical protein